MFLFAALPLHRSYETKGVIPECIELDDITCTWNDRFAVVCRVHPCDGLSLGIRIEQAVVIHPEVRMPVGSDIVNDVMQQGTIEFQTTCLAGLLGILLYSPHTPQRYIWLLHLIDVDAERPALHEFTQSFPGSLHYQFEIVLLLNAQGKSGESDELVTCAALEPRIAGKNITFVIL